MESNYKRRYSLSRYDRKGVLEIGNNRVVGFEDWVFKRTKRSYSIVGNSIGTIEVIKVNIGLLFSLKPKLH